MTTTPPTAETQVATALAQVADLAVGLKEITQKVTTLQAASGTQLDVTKITQEYEAMRAQIEGLQNAIRTSKRGIGFPGVEDIGKQFNLARLCSAVARGSVEKHAPFEHEVVKTTKQAMEKSGQLRAGHTMWDDSAGGLWVPDQLLADVIGPLYAQSALIALDPATGSTLISVLDGLTGNPTKLPEFEGGMIAYWIGEEDDYAESKTKSGNIEMSPKKLGCMTRMTEELMQFANPQLDAFIRRDMAMSLAKKLDWTAMYGKPTAGTRSIPTGVFENPKVKKWYSENSSETAPGAFTAGGTELTFDKLMEMQGAIEDRDVVPDSSFGIVSSRRYFRRLKRSKVDSYAGQTTNQAYLLGAPYISDNLLKSIIGSYAQSTQIATKKMIGGTTPGTHDKGGDVMMGNLREIIMGRWGGIQIVNDGGTGAGFVRDQTYIKMRTWVDFQVRQAEALRHCPDAKVRD